MVINPSISHFLTDSVRIIHDYPKPGIDFVDISSITAVSKAFSNVIDCFHFAIRLFSKDVTLVGVDSRGFIFAGALAYYDDLPLVLARKKGKLPAETVSQKYSLEYGTAEIEMNQVDLVPGRKYVIVDDIVATGGTVGAIEKLITSFGGKVEGVLALYQIRACMKQLSANVNAPVYTLAEI